MKVAGNAPCRCCIAEINKSLVVGNEKKKEHKKHLVLSEHMVMVSFDEEVVTLSCSFVFSSQLEGLTIYKSCSQAGCKILTCLMLELM